MGNKREDSLTAKKKLSDFIMFAQDYDVPEFKASTKTFINWSHEILNSFDYPHTNGYTKSCNNKNQGHQTRCLWNAEFSPLQITHSGMSTLN